LTTPFTKAKSGAPDQVRGDETLYVGAYRHRSLFRQVVPRILDAVEEPFGLRTFVAGFGALKFAQQFTLARIELGRGLNLDFDHEIARTPPLQHRHAGTAFAQLLARLDSGGDLDRVTRPVESGQFDRTAQRRSGKLIGARVISVVPSRSNMACRATWMKI